MIGIGNSAHGGHALRPNPSDFTRGQTDLRVVSVTTDQLRIIAGSTGDLTTLAGL